MSSSANRTSPCAARSRPAMLAPLLPFPFFPISPSRVSRSLSVSLKQRTPAGSHRQRPPWMPPELQFAMRPPGTGVPRPDPSSSAPRQASLARRRRAKSAFVSASPARTCYGLFCSIEQRQRVPRRRRPPPAGPPPTRPSSSPALSRICSSPPRAAHPRARIARSARARAPPWSRGAPAPCLRRLHRTSAPAPPSSTPSPPSLEHPWPSLRRRCLEVSPSGHLEIWPFLALDKDKPPQLRSSPPPSPSPPEPPCFAKSPAAASASPASSERGERSR